MQHYNNKKYFKVDLTMVPNSMLLAFRSLIECEEKVGEEKGGGGGGGWYKVQFNMDLKNHTLNSSR